MFEKFDDFRIQVGDVTVAGKVSHEGRTQRPPLLLLHGHPENHMMWNKVADCLADSYTVIAPDLRGYGATSRPETDADHSPYSKRAMATDQILLMKHFGEAMGFESFAVCAHDRGARVAHRLMVDYPAAVSRAVLMDIAPTLDMYDGTTQQFAQSYFHWFFLTQPAPLPESLISANPRGYIENLMGGRHAGLAPFGEEALESYIQSLSQPGAVHSMCEDYRASAGIDLDHERADREAGRKITTPLRVLWGEYGVVGRLFDPLRLWKSVATDVSGRALPAGHYLPEEVPDAIYNEILDFIPAT